MGENFNPFDEINEKYTGTLMEIEESYETRYVCKIWYDYTRDLFNKIKEGSFIVVKNFQIPEKDNTDCYSILKIVKKLPTHYATDNRLKGSYPAFSEEAIKGVRDSFIDQRDESFEDLTKIRVEAIPANSQISLGDETKTIEEIKIENDESLPILGEEAKILSKKIVEKIINRDLVIEDANIVEIATLKDEKDVRIFLDIERCIKTHFGIFGFTGVGKTNLLSTFISKLFNNDIQKKKILFFDIMDEYLGLLIDLFFKKNVNAYYIFLDYSDLSLKIARFFESGEISDDLIESFYNQMVLPKELKTTHLKERFYKIIIQLFQEKKIKFFQKRNRIIDWLESLFSSFLQKIDIRPKEIFKDAIIEYYENLLEGKFNIYRESMTNDIKDMLFVNLKERIERGHLTKVPKKKAKKEEPQKTIFESISNPQKNKEYSKKSKKEYYFHSNFSRSTWQNQLKNFINNLDQKEVLETSKYGDYVVDKRDIIEEVHSEDKNSLFIFVSSKEQTVREFLNNLGKSIYNKRKKEGLIGPLTSLIFDEADTFIPQGVQEDSVIASKKIVEQIARRGRKFGLGIGLATQRITFLETNILAQLHTYFISRLPRKSDRDRIKEAFSLSDQEFEETITFIKGNWLLVSHEGLGIEGVPLSIKAENANERIKYFLDNK